MKEMCCLGAMAVMAASANASEPVDTLAAQTLQEVQVVSTRATDKMPLAFKNVGKDEIKAVNYGKDVPFLLSLTPSVTLTSDAGNGIGYTTMRVRGADPSRTNITANGVPMNDSESSSLYWVNFGDFASSAQSIQIQRGVGTSTNGAGAFGATVNILTEPIGSQPFAGIDLSAGSYYAHKETVRFGTGLINGHWGIQGRLSNIGSKGYLDRASTKLNSYFLQAGYFGDKTVVKFITFNGQEETYHAWNYTSKYEQSLYGRRYNSCGLYYDENGNMRYYDNQTDNYHSQNYQLIWNETLSRLWNLNVALHYTRGDGYYEEYKVNKDLQEYGLATSKFKTDLIRQKQMGNDFYGAIASLNFDNRQGLSANIGGGWNKYDGDHWGNVIWVRENADVNVLPGFEYYRNNAKKTDFNIYGKVNYELVRGLNGFIDLQYRHVGYKMQDPSDWYLGTVAAGPYVINEDFNFFNPKFGLTYDFDIHNRVYASYAISHKEPVRNNYEDSYENGTDMPKAERLNDLELGYKYQSAKFTAGLNLYYMDYKDQFVLTGELNDIGEAITRNFDSYRLGAELEAAWMPVDWFRWDINATWSRNRIKDMVVALDDGSGYDLGDTPMSFSPDFIFNNILTFSYAGFKASIQSQYISEQYLTNYGFKTMECNDKYDDNWAWVGNTTQETLMLGDHFTTNIDLSYSFSLKKFGLKDANVGVTLYNVFNAKYDNNGWAAPQFKVENGTLKAVNEWGPRDSDAAGFAPSAPFNFMAHLSLNF